MGRSGDALGKARAADEKRKRQINERQNGVRTQTVQTHRHVSLLTSDSPEEEEQEGLNVLPDVALERGGDDDDDSSEMCEDFSVQRTREDTIQVSVPEYWQVVETSTTATMNLFLRLFLPKCGVLQKNKPIKWITLQNKIVLTGVLTKTQFDSRVEDLSRTLRSVNVKLAELEPGTPPTDELDHGVNEQTIDG
jgi:hypothetical protein